MFHVLNRTKNEYDKMYNITYVPILLLGIKKICYSVIHHHNIER